MKKDTIDLESYKYDLGRIDEALVSLLNSNGTAIKDVINWSILKNKQKLRALFFVISCQLCNYGEKNVYQLSTIFEYIQVASMLHEDILDNADIKGENNADNHLCGNDKVLLEGNFLYSKAANIAVDSNNFLFLKKVMDTTTQITEGQILEMIHKGDWSTDSEQYMNIFTSKSALLLSAACTCGAIIAGSDGVVEKSLEKFGMNVGIALQLKEDLTKYRSLKGVIEETDIKDLKEGKITLPLIYTLATLEEAERERFAELHRNNHATLSDYGDLLRLVNNNGSLDQIMSEARSYIDEATSCLNTIPDSSLKNDFLELARHIIEKE